MSLAPKVVCELTKLQSLSDEILLDATCYSLALSISCLCLFLLPLFLPLPPLLLSPHVASFCRWILLCGWGRESLIKIAFQGFHW